MKMNKSLTIQWVAALLFSTFGVFTQEGSKVVPDKPLKSGVIKENMDTYVNPGNNFTKYVNGSWMKSTKIPADKSSYGTMNILRDESEDEVKTIIEEAA